MYHVQRLCRLLSGNGPAHGKVANTVLRLKRQETHRIFDAFWRELGWTRSEAYRWLARELRVPEDNAHIAMMEMDECEQVIRLCRDQYISVLESHYKLRLELPLNMNAKAFFEKVSDGSAYEMLSEADIQLGEIIEIDDGLKPYYFYYLNWSTVVPVLLFDRSKVQKGV